LDVISSPQSPFASRFTQEISLNLDFEIESQQADGYWSPTWSWGDAFPKVWEIAQREWKGILTLQKLRLLKVFDRLEQG
jgi:hypothetical protein